MLHLNSMGKAHRDGMASHKLVFFLFILLVLTCSSLIIKDVEHLFKDPLNFCYGFFGKHLY